MKGFSRKLEINRNNSAELMHSSLHIAGLQYLHRLNSTAQRLDTVLAPARETIRAERLRYEEEDIARRRLKELRRFNSRSASRPRQALNSWAKSMQHPIVAVNFCSASLFSMLLLLAGVDVALTNSGMVPASLRLFQEQWAFSAWWLAMGIDVSIYLLSMSMILGGLIRGDDWAAQAVGSVDEEDSTTSEVAAARKYRLPSEFFIRFEYDWGREEWREVYEATSTSTSTTGVAKQRNNNADADDEAKA
jgi:hypothetical protein